MPPLLDRTHRFLRLQRAVGWADTVLDDALTDPAIGNGTLDDAALVRIALLARIATRTGIQAEELSACFGRDPARRAERARRDAADLPPHLSQQVDARLRRGGAAAREGDGRRRHARRPGRIAVGDPEADGRQTSSSCALR